MRLMVEPLIEEVRQQDKAWEVRLSLAFRSCGSQIDPEKAPVEDVKENLTHLLNVAQDLLGNIIVNQDQCPE